jgi:hypothetical protein
MQQASFMFRAFSVNQESIRQRKKHNIGQLRPGCAIVDLKR